MTIVMLLRLLFLPKFCKACQVWEKEKGTVEIQHWKCTHKCQINRSGSSGVMESAGPIEMFCSSGENYRLINE